VNIVRGQQTEILLPQNNFKTHQSNKSTPLSERQVEDWACKYAHQVPSKKAARSPFQLGMIIGDFYINQNIFTCNLDLFVHDEIKSSWHNID